MTWSDAAVVNSGIGLLEEALTGEPIEIVDAGGGAGVVESAALLAQTDLLDQRQDVTVANIQDEPGGGKKILLRITSKGVMEAYNMTQIGIWGTCGSKGRVLFALLQDQKGISIPTEASMPDFLLEFYAIVLVSGNVQFTYTVDPNALASVGDLQAAVGKMDDALREVVKNTEGKLSSAATSEEVASDDTFAMVPADGDGTKRVAFSVIIDSLKATLDPRYRVPEYDGLASFPAQGEAGRIYVDTLTDKAYRWDGTGYVEISKGVTEAEELGYIDNKKLNATNAQDAIDAVAQHAIDAGAAAAEADKIAGEAKKTADEARQIAGKAKIAAGDAQKAADAALEAVTRLAHTIEVIPTQNGILTYTGSAQSPSWNSYNPDAMTLGGVVSGTNAGSYNATFTPKEGYTWKDGTAEPKSVTWVIGRASITVTPSQNGSLTYTGNAQSPAWSNFDTAKLSLGGTTSGTNAGSYNATFTPTANYQWSDGTTVAKNINWTINRATIAVTPSPSGSLTYTGSTQSPTWSNYNGAQLTIGGATSGTNAGTYTATFTPTDNYQWSGNETGSRPVSWGISKAEGSLSLNKTSMTLINGALTNTITVTRPGDGVITAKSSNTSVATVSVSGTTVTVTGKAYGSATITVNVAAGSNHNAPADKTCVATVKLYNTTLNSNTWARIREASDSGKAANVWSVGDTKTIIINGITGGVLLDNLSINVFIIGINHNSSREGANRIHFQIGKIGGQLRGLKNGSYETESSSTTNFQMNAYVDNQKGWEGCTMRSYLMGGSGAPTNPPLGSLLAILPSDLLAVMKSCTKYSDNTGGSSDTASYVTATTDYLFLLSEFEYHGVRKYANSAEQTYQAQYDYYKAGNSKVHYSQDWDSPVYTWCRSVVVGAYGNFCVISLEGKPNSKHANYSQAVAPGFCV